MQRRRANDSAVAVPILNNDVAVNRSQPLLLIFLRDSSPKREGIAVPNWRAKTDIEGL